MAENNLEFLKSAFIDYKVHISDDGVHAIIFNPFYDENVTVYYYEDDDFTPFCARFSFQHCHLQDEEDVVEWINEIISGRIFAIEFFNNEQHCFGSDINADDLNDLTYTKLEQLTGYYGLTKLLDIVDSFKVRGWDRKNNFDAVFVFEQDGSISIEKA